MMDSPSKASIAVVIIRVIGVMFQAGVIVLLANNLDIADMGIFSATYVFWGLARMLGAVGHDQLGLREIAYARAHDKQAFARAIYGHVVGVSAKVSSCAGGVALAVLLGLGAMSFHNLTSFDVLLIAVAVPAFSLLGVQADAARGFDRTISSQAVDQFGLHFATGACLLGQLAITDLTLTSTLFWMTACGWLTVGAFIIMLRRNVLGETESLTEDDKSRLWREGFEIWQALLLIGLATRTPTYISLTVLGPTQTALLEIATRFGTLPTVFTSGVTTTFAPLLARLYARKDTALLSENLAVSSWLSFVPSACAFLGAVVLGPWLLATFFPPVYGSAYWPLLVIILATTVNGGFGMSSILLLMTGNQRLVRQYSLYQFVIVAVSGLLFSYLFGVVGLAMAFFLGFVVFDVGLALQIERVLQVKGFLHVHGLRTLVASLVDGRLRI